MDFPDKLVASELNCTEQISKQIEVRAGRRVKFTNTSNPVSELANFPLVRMYQVDNRERTENLAKTIRLISRKSEKGGPKIALPYVSRGLTGRTRNSWDSGILLHMLSSIS